MSTYRMHRQIYKTTGSRLFRASQEYLRAWGSAEVDGTSRSGRELRGPGGIDVVEPVYLWLSILPLDEQPCSQQCICFAGRSQSVVDGKRGYDPLLGDGRRVHGPSPRTVSIGYSAHVTYALTQPQSRGAGFPKQDPYLLGPCSNAKTPLTLHPLPPTLPANLPQMPPTDRTPLLENGHGANGHIRRLSYKERFVSLFSVPEDQPGWIKSFRFFFFGSWMNLALVFVPLSFVAHHLHWDAALRFAFSFISIMPLAKVT